METTVFRNGGSQAVRIPAKYRFDSDVVDIEWNESLNALVIKERSLGKWTSFFESLAKRPSTQLPAELPLTPEGRLDVAAFMDME
jgi:virulence-associated protein VagC